MILFYAAIVIITNHLILAFVLFFSPKLSNLHNKLLALLLTAIALIHIIVFLIYWKIHIYQYFIGLEYALGALIGPFIYLYIKSYISKPNFNFKSIKSHFIPSSLFLLFYLYGQYNRSLSYSIAQIGEKPFQMFEYSCDIIVNTSIIVYIILSINLYRKAKKQNTIKKAHYQWLKIFFRTTIVVAAISIPLGFIANGKYTGIYTVLITFLYFLVLMWQSVSTSKIFANDLKSTEQNGYDLQDFSILHQYLIKQKPYTNHDLTLEMLAEQLELPKNYLSKMINNHLKMNFFELVNSYRVEDAKFKLLNREFQNYTIDAIAKESGFKSRTSFYDAFKKQTGMTPTEFRLNNLANKN